MFCCKNEHSAFVLTVMFGKLKTILYKLECIQIVDFVRL